MSDPLRTKGTLSLSSDPRDVEHLLTRLESLLATSCLDEMRAFRLKCAVIEVANNCIQHAYMNQTGKPIEISYDFKPELVQIVIADQGPAFFGPTESPGITPMGDSGRGLQIIEAWVSSFSFERKNHWNLCRLEQLAIT